MAEGVAVVEVLRMGHADAHRNERGVGKGGHQCLRKVGPSDEKLSTGVQGHKQGKGPGTGHRS